MQSFLLLRLEAPLIAFGDILVDARGPVSDLPSASMLTGLLANALGLDRVDRAAHQRLQDRLIHAARLDRTAGRFTEFQTVRLAKDDRAWTTRHRPVGRDGGDSTYDSPYLRHRDHDADVVAHVALRLEPADETPDLPTLAAALDEPARPLFLGRKHCLPVDRISRGLVEAGTLLEALCRLPLAEPAGRSGPAASEAGSILVELPAGEAIPDGVQVRRLHRCDRRDWIAGVHAGDTVRWTARLAPDVFPRGGEA